MQIVNVKSAWNEIFMSELKRKFVSSEWKIAQNNYPMEKLSLINVSRSHVFELMFKAIQSKASLTKEETVIFSVYRKI